MKEKADEVLMDVITNWSGHDKKPFSVLQSTKQVSNATANASSQFSINAPEEKFFRKRCCKYHQEKNTGNFTII